MATVESHRFRKMSKITGALFAATVVVLLASISLAHPYRDIVGAIGLVLFAALFWVLERS